MANIFRIERSFSVNFEQMLLTIWMMSVSDPPDILGAIRSATILEEFSLNASTCFEFTTFRSSLLMGARYLLRICEITTKSSTRMAINTSNHNNMKVGFESMPEKG